MSSDRSWTSIILRAMLFLACFSSSSFFFYLFKHYHFALLLQEEVIHVRVLVKNVRRKSGRWKVELINVSQWPFITEWHLRSAFSKVGRIIQGQNLEVILCILWHTWAEPPQSPLETLPGVGAGRRSCCTIRLDSELMGLPRRPGPVLYLPTYTASVWKRPPKASSLSPHMSWS